MKVKLHQGLLGEQQCWIWWRPSWFHLAPCGQATAVSHHTSLFICSDWEFSTWARGLKIRPTSRRSTKMVILSWNLHIFLPLCHNEHSIVFLMRLFQHYGFPLTKSFFVFYFFLSLSPLLAAAWADNANACAKQYAGTGALKTDFTRWGRRLTCFLLIWGLAN